MAAVVQHLPQCQLQLLPGIRQGQAQRGPAVDGLHRCGQRQFLRQTRNVLRRIGQLPPGERRNARAFHHLLGDGLVHRHAGTQVSGTGIGDPQQVESRLDAPVLAALAMETQEHRVRMAANLQYAGAEKAGRPVLPGCADRRQVGSLGRNLLLGTKAVRSVKDILPRALPGFQSQEHVHQNRPVAQAPQCTADSLPGHQRHLALRGQAAGQYDNIQIRFLSVLTGPPHAGTAPAYSNRAKASASVMAK